jgi:hypothetical protein
MRLAFWKKNQSSAETDPYERTFDIMITNYEHNPPSDRFPGSEAFEITASYRTRIDERTTIGYLLFTGQFPNPEKVALVVTSDPVKELANPATIIELKPNSEILISGDVWNHKKIDPEELFERVYIPF